MATAARPAPLPAVRLRRALTLLQTVGAVSCQDLQREFRISPATARRDIEALVRRGRAVRVHGGAVAATEAVAMSAAMRDVVRATTR